MGEEQIYHFKLEFSFIWLRIYNGSQKVVEVGKDTIQNNLVLVGLKDTVDLVEYNQRAGDELVPEGLYELHLQSLVVLVI